MSDIEKASWSPLQTIEASRGEETALLVEQTCGRVCEPLTRLLQSFLLTKITKKQYAEEAKKPPSHEGGGVEKKNRDVWLNRHPMGRTYRSSGTFRNIP